MRQTSYDQLPYPSVPKVWSHPDRLATLARLYGMAPPPVERCRVLELGCADGGNLLPMAAALPGCEFVGLDYAPRQVAAGQAMIDGIGLSNISLHAADVRTIGREYGQFDYIIAYGIYSWVPPDVQDAILRICRERLAPNGVAFVSYNTFPGWHARTMVREMLLYRVGQIDDPRERVARARAFLDFLVDATGDLRDRYSRLRYFGVSRAIIEAERDLLRTQGDTYVLHELLEEVNSPVYFHEFAARAAEHGLQYLAEAEFAMTQLDNLPEAVATQMRQMSRSRIEAEQYLDFLSSRTFRQTLLCHAGIPLEPCPEAIMSLAIASPLAPASAAPDVREGVRERFDMPSGTTLVLTAALGKAALLELRESWPQPLPFRELVHRARLRAGVPAEFPTMEADALPGGVPPERPQGDPEAVLLAQQLLRCYSLDLVELHSYVPDFTLAVSARPVACPVARYQAQHGLTIASRRHQTVTLDGELPRTLLGLLDGSRDRATLLEEVRCRVEPDLVAPLGEGEVDRRQRVAEAIDEALHLLARSALLVA